jgi:hypothetical protein
MPRPSPHGRAFLRATAIAFACASAVCSPSSSGPDTPDSGGTGGNNGASGSSGASGHTGSAGAPGPTTGTGGATGAGGGSGAGATGGAPAIDAGTPTGTGLNKGGQCYPICAFPAITNPSGNGYGWEQQRSCLVAASAAATGTIPCNPTPLPNMPTPGNGIFDGQSCLSFCSSARTDTTGSGYGFEHGRNCIVPATAAAYGGISCAPAALPTGDGVMLTAPPPGSCAPICVNPLVSDPDADGFGFENNLVCVVSTSLAALQNTPCNAPDPPPPPPPPPAPPGAGWRTDYTATMFGQNDCAPLGVSDATNLNGSTCVARGAVQLSGANTMFFGAAGDLSSLWNNAPACSCNGQEVGGRCGSPPGCGGQTDCGQCVEVTCNFTGIYSFNDDGFKHDEFCKPGKSVVVQLIDACPHNHPNNTYWCTTARPQHIDLSCTAFSNITVSSTARPLSTIGSVNVQVRPVNCNVGLGVKSF